MLQLFLIEKFEQLFIKLPSIVEMITSSDSYSAAEEVTGWLTAAQNLSEENKLKICADIALIKGKMLTYLPSQNGVDIESGRMGRKLKNRYMVECLQEAKDCIEQYLEKSRILIEESSVLCRKLAAVAVSKGYIHNKKEDIQEIIGIVKQDSDLMPALTNVIGTVGYFNTEILLKRAVDEVILS